ncbi:diacylglycerol kinase family protein [Capnocytophaga sp.]|uniref:diacylglycerol kinase family protein n=1 Tax=Capnocytophaga sp. TaxID=44737 RepID=UPI0026DC112E|nr:diacylglycerol kinase family protein [Capnocytophaga sp.]MDO5105462.1 diacylglycerol kinase family protein [Capnocytophaga sp.]
MITFIKNRIRSLYYVLVGVWYLVRKEPPIFVHVFVTLFLFFLGFYFGISKTEWMIQILCCGSVLTIESLNTAIEKICDFIHPEYHKKIGVIKDISAGAVGFAVGTATIVLSILYYPHFF